MPPAHRPSFHLRAGVLLTTVAVPGLVLASRASDAVPALTWFALVAAPSGVLTAPFTTRLSTALAGAVAWLVVVGLTTAAPAAWWGGCTVAGLYLVGSALGQLRANTWRVAGTVFLCTGLLAGLPDLRCVRRPSVEPPWPPVVAAWLLDLSPVTLVVEGAGIDWMRHSDVYVPVGTDRIGPSQRVPWTAAGAGWTALLAGLGLVGLSRTMRRRGQAAE